MSSTWIECVKCNGKGYKQLWDRKRRCAAGVVKCKKCGGKGKVEV